MAGATRAAARADGPPGRPTKIPPGVCEAFVRQALQRAIQGIGPLPPAVPAAEKQLREEHGDVDRAIHEAIEIPGRVPDDRRHRRPPRVGRRRPPGG